MPLQDFSLQHFSINKIDLKDENQEIYLQSVASVYNRGKMMMEKAEGVKLIIIIYLPLSLSSNPIKLFSLELRFESQK